MKARFLFPLLTAAASLMGCIASKPQKPIDTRIIDTRTPVSSSYISIHGIEYAYGRSDAYFWQNNTYSILLENQGDVGISVLGDAFTPLNMDTISHHLLAQKRFKTDDYNIDLFFHGAPIAEEGIDTTFIIGQSLENRFERDSTDITLTATALFQTMGEALYKITDKDDRVRIRHISCYGMSGLVGMGHLPPNTHVWAASSAENWTWECHTGFMQCFKAGAPWNTMGNRHMIESSILLQNSVVTEEAPSKWNPENFVVIVTDRDGRYDRIQTPTQALDFGPNELRVIDLNRAAINMLCDFPMDSVQKAARTCDKFVPMMQRTKQDMRILSKKLNPFYMSDPTYDFNDHLVDSVLKKLPSVKTPEDFENNLSDPERSIAKATAYLLYSRPENWDLLPVAGEYAREHHIKQRRRTVYPFDLFNPR